MKKKKELIINRFSIWMDRFATTSTTRSPRRLCCDCDYSNGNWKENEESIEPRNKYSACKLNTGLMGKMTRPNIVIINLKCWSILESLSIFYQHQHVLSTRQSNFQLSVESDSGLVWFHLSSHCYWSRRFAPSPQPIRCKTKNNRDLVRRIFPRFKQFACFHVWVLTGKW